MKAEVVKAKGGPAGSLLPRIKSLAGLIDKFSAEMPDDAVRIEIDVEYSDGGRVKLEGKA